MPKTKIPAAMSRIYERVFVCMRCNAKLRSDASRIGTVKCRKCGYKGLRAKSKERKV